MYDRLKADQGQCDLSYARLPIVDEKAPKEKDFDVVLGVLRRQPADAACVFNCQMGKGRTTTGMILACLVKDVLHASAAAKKFEELPNVDAKQFEDEDDAQAEVRKRNGEDRVMNSPHFRG